MIRIVTGALLVALCLPGGASQAEGAPAPLGTHLSYRTVSWHGEESDPDGPFAGVSVEVPVDWAFVLTPDKQGRFSDATHTWLLTVQWPEQSRPVRDEVRRQVRALRGTSGLRVLRRDVLDSPDHTEAHGVLAYRYRDSAGQARWVSYRYDGPPDGPVTDVVAVAGRPEDRTGLTRVLRQAVQTLGEAG